MFKLFGMRTADVPKGLLTEQQAREIIDVEIARRGWIKLANESYRVKRQGQRYVWHYQGTRMSRPNMQIMGVEIDATTGDVVESGLYPEKAWGPR